MTNFKFATEKDPISLKQILKTYFPSLQVKFGECKQKHLIEEREFDQTCTISGGTEEEREDCLIHFKSLLGSIIVKKVDITPFSREF